MREKILAEYWQEAKQVCAERKKRGSPEFPTGIKFIDEVTGGLHRGEIWIIAGKTGSGKTSLGLQLARNFADIEQHTVLFLTLEMRGWELVLRMYSEMQKENYSNLISGKIEVNPIKDKTFTNFINNIDFEIVEYGYNWEEVMLAFNKFYHDKKPDVIFLDYMQLIGRKGFEDERLAIVDYIRKIKEYAKKHDIAFVIVSQIRRLPTGADYNRPPDVNDLKGSGDLEQTADKIILVYKKTENETINHYLNLAKNRQGKTACRQVIFEGEYYHFKDREESEVEKKLSYTFGAREV